LADILEECHLIGTAPDRVIGAETPDQLFLPYCADSARDALATRLVSKERGDSQEDVAHVDRFIEDEHHARSKRCTGRARVFKRQPHIQLV
jgi:hypothetical protein